MDMLGEMVTLQISDEMQWYIDNHLTHQIHTSERKAFRACRRRWDWVYNEMYTPQVNSEPLEFGIAFHRAMEIFYEPRTWLSSLEVRTDLALVAFKMECDKQLKHYMRLHSDPDVEVLNSYKNRLELGLNMIRHYCEKMSPIYDHGWTPVRVEVGFEVPINDSDTQKQLWCKCDRCWSKYKKYKDIDEATDLWKSLEWKGLPVTYGGRLDALFQDKHGRYWIADWKTTSRLLDEDAESSFLQLDDQVASYLWALSQYGINCAGFVYVEIKKAFPKPPERLARVTKGRSFSTNKQNLTTYAIFLKTIQKEDNAAWQMGLYDEYLAWLRNEGAKFTQRHQIHKNVAEINNAGAVIALEAMDMINDPRIYPQPGRFSCNWCLFKQPCLGVNMNEDYQYTLDTMFTKKTKLYWEEKEASTD